MVKWGLVLLVLAFLLPAESSAASCHPDDLRALRGFAKNLTGGGSLLRTAWSGASCCSWEGVGCDGVTGRVTALWLPRRSLGDCSELTSLNLANNKLVGTIPSWMGGLDHLCYLDLSGNSLVAATGMDFSSMPVHVEGNRRSLDSQEPNTITGTNNHVKSGRINRLSGNDNIVYCGNNNTVSGSNNTVLSGSNNTVSGSNQVVCGNNHIVTDNNNNVDGHDNNVSGSFHTVSGSHNTVSGSNNTVSGRNHIVTGSNKVVTGG